MPDQGTVKEPSTEGVVPDDELEKQVARNQARRAGRNSEPVESGLDGPELIRAVADGEPPTPAEIVDATEWLLSNDQRAYTHTIQINVGSPTQEVWVDWEIRPVDLDTLKKIREASQGGTNRQRRRSAQTGEMDEVEANIRIVVEGTVTPDLKAVAAEKRMVDPGDVLRQRFAHKPGLLGQISGEVMSISGYDDEDVREVDAAKNS